MPIVWHLIVEGECEKRYFAHLQHLIWAAPDLEPVEIESVVSNAPASFARRLAPPADGGPRLGEKIWYVADVEGDQPPQMRVFEKRLRDLRAAGQAEPDLEFFLAYSNCAFELWMILHKAEFFRTITHKGQYLKPLQDAFGDIRSLAFFKRQRVFERVLRQIALGDVLSAIRRADRIQYLRSLEGPPLKYCGYSFYRKNPSLSVGDLAREILRSAGMDI